MTHTPVKWVNVLFGVALTLLVAIAPMVFVLLSGQSAQAHASSSSGASTASALHSVGMSLPGNGLMLLLFTAAAFAALASVIFVSTRAEHVR